MTTIPIGRCRPGTRFRVPTLGITGLLLYANECRARVRIDQPPREVEITGRNGRKRGFVAKRRHETDWAPSVPVVPIGTEPVPPTRQKETTMPTKKKTTKPATKSGRTTATKKAARKKKATSASRTKKSAQPKSATRVGKLSALDAAAKVIAEADGPMSARELIETMARRKLWTSPGGKTPSATLYAAIAREIAKKGSDARFRKHDRGRFVTAATTASKRTAKKTSGKKAATKKTTAKKSVPANGTPGPKAVSELFQI